MLVKLKTFSLLGIEALPVKGALSMAIAAGKQEGLRGLAVSSESAAEAAVVENVEVIPVARLTQAIGLFTGTLDIEPTPSRLDELRVVLEARRRFCRRPRPGDGQAGDYDRRRRRAQLVKVVAGLGHLPKGTQLQAGAAVNAIFGPECCGP